MIRKVIAIGGLALAFTGGIGNAQSVVGTWQCQGTAFGESTVGSEFSFDPTGNFRMVMQLGGPLGTRIIGGGQYTFAPTEQGDFNLHLTPVDWLPKQICSGPFGQGGNCTPVALQPADVFFQFVDPNTTRTRNGDLCQRASAPASVPDFPSAPPQAPASVSQAPSAGGGQSVLDFLK
jgi:hypothetical protein